MNDRLLTLALALGLLALPTGCPSTDDDDSADDDDTTSDDDDTTGDDDDSAATVTELTLSADVTETDTRGSITLTVTADWSDGAEETVDETDGVVFGTNAKGSGPVVINAGVMTSAWINIIEVTATYEGVTSPAVTVTFLGAAPQVGDLILHELLVDGTAGDANGDCTTDGDQDAFVEFLNTADVELDLEGLQLLERDFDPNLPRHTFAADTSVGPGQALVVFGGGSADISPAGASVFVADNASDPGTQLYLHLDPTGDIVKLRDGAGTLLVEFAYGSESDPVIDANLDEAITLDPQVTGTTWAAHSSLTGAVGDYSPGTLADGTAF